MSVAPGGCRTLCSLVLQGCGLTFPLSRPDSNSLNSVHQPSTPSLFNTFPLHSNDTNKVIDTRCTFVLFFHVFAIQNLRRSTSLAPAALRPHQFRHRDEIRVARHVLRPFLSYTSALFHFPYPATPLFATLTKTTGVYTNNSHSGTRHRRLKTISFLLTPFRTLLHFFAVPQNSTHFDSYNSALFAKNTGGGEGCNCLPDT
jgi:hypothetical protein